MARRENGRKGLSIIETILVLGLLGVVGTVMLTNLVGRKSTSELSLTAQRVASLLRDAQSRSVSQVSSTAWSVRFDNATTGPYYALYAGSTFTTSSQESRYALPSTLRFASTTINTGKVADVYFSQLTGMSSGSSSIRIYMIKSPQSSTTITIDPSGAITY